MFRALCNRHVNLERIARTLGAMVFLFSAAIPSAGANYDKTKWGMSIAKVKGLYPMGAITKLQNGDTSYGVVRPVAGFTTGYILFHFGPKDGLKEVSIVFPVQGTRVDLKTGTFAAMKNAQCESFYAMIFEKMTAKYGPAMTVKSESAAWVTKEIDFIFLGVSHNQPDAEHCGVSLSYSKLQGDTTNGL